MASKKRQSMLSKQRQLRNQQQQVRRASSNQLPPKGGSSAGSKPARVQRANTAKAQAANNQRVVTRGIQGFIRRGQANDKAAKAARGTGPSGTTRTAGAGGGLARRPESRPATQGRGGAATNSSQSGGLARRGGLTTTGSTKATDGRIQRVSVRDVTGQKPAVRGGSTPPRLPAPRPAVNGSTARGLLKGAAKEGAKGLGRYAGPIAMGIATADQARQVVNPKRNIVTALSDLGNSIAHGGKPGPGHSQFIGPVPQREKPKGGQGNRGRNGSKPAPASKPAPKATAAQISALTDKGGIFNMNGTGNVKPRPKANAGSGGSGGGGGGSRGSSGGGGSRPAPAAPKSKPRFTGTVDEGRRIWAEKYSGDKYKGQAIHKEATKALEKMKNNESGKRAQNIGKKGASPASAPFEPKTKIDPKKVPDFKKIKGRQFGK